MSQSQKMRRALQKYVLPKLLEEGFTGKYPHYKKETENWIDLLTFQVNNWGNSFTVEVSTVFLKPSGRSCNCCGIFAADLRVLENINVWYTDRRYRLKGMFDGWFYYTDVYSSEVCGEKNRKFTFYNAVSETRAKTYIPAENEVLVQKADADIYRKICEEVNRQMENAYLWWDAFHKNKKWRMKKIEEANR